MKRTAIIGLVCCLLAATVTAEDFDFEKVKSKSDGKKGETLVFKGFYLGMPIADAQGMINHYMGLKQVSATPVVNTNSAAADPAAAAMAQAFANAFAQMGVATEDKSASYQVFKKKDQLVVAQSESDRPFAIADGDGKVVMFDLSKPVRNKLFDAAATPTKEFLQTFINAYDVPSMESEQIKLMANVFGMQSEAGIQSILRHRSPKGYELTYYDDVFWTDDESQAFVTYVPSEHITVKKIKTAKQRESKFD